MIGLAPLSASGPGQPIDHARGDALSLLSDEAKALVVGEVLDMRQALDKGGDKHGVRVLDSVLRRIVRGLYRYELRRADSLRPDGVDIDTTRW